MGKFIFGLLALAILALIAFAWFDRSYQSQRQTAAWAQSERERVAVAAEATATALNLQRQQTVAPVATAVQSGMYVSLGLAAGLGVLAGAMFLFLFLARRLVLVRPDRQGVLPTPLFTGMFADLRDDARASLKAYHTTAYANAVHQPGQTPQHLTYSPHTAPRLDIRNERTRIPEQLTDYALPSLEAAIVPTFAQLLDGGRIGRGNPITIGFDATGQPVETDWKGLYSSAIGGRQGSGKSWTASGIIAQSVLHGARLVICDIHAGDNESISNRIAPLAPAFLFDTADSPKSVVTAVKNVDAILTARSSGKDHTRNVVLLVFDEFTSTLRRLGNEADTVADLLANIASEGRKFGIFALLIGHNWTADATGGTQVRDNLTSAMVHNLRPNEARMMTGLTAASLPSDTHSLSPGQYYLLPKSGDIVKVQSPHMTDADMQRVGQLLLSDGAENLYDLRRSERATVVEETIATTTGNEPETNRTSTAAATVNIPSQSVILPSAEAAEAQRLFFGEKKTIAEIVYQLRGVKGNQGTRYQQALLEVQDLLRQGIAGAA